MMACEDPGCHLAETKRSREHIGSTNHNKPYPLVNLLLLGKTHSSLPPTLRDNRRPHATPCGGTVHGVRPVSDTGRILTVDPASIGGRDGHITSARTNR